LKKKIIIVDDHEVVRLGLKSLLDQYPQYEVISEAGSANEAIQQVKDSVFGFLESQALKHVRKLKR